MAHQRQAAPGGPGDTAPASAPAEAADRRAGPGQLPAPARARGPPAPPSQRFGGHAPAGCSAPDRSDRSSSTRRRSWAMVRSRPSGVRLRWASSAASRPLFGDAMANEQQLPLARCIRSALQLQGAAQAQGLSSRAGSIGGSRPGPTAIHQRRERAAGEAQSPGLPTGQQPLGGGPIHRPLQRGVRRTEGLQLVEPLRRGLTALALLVEHSQSLRPTRPSRSEVERAPASWACS